jgi:hypothetical protein
MNTNTTTNKKTTLTAILPDGTTATRKTARVYTHLVAELYTAAEQIEDATRSRGHYESLVAKYAALDPGTKAEGYWNTTNGQVADKYRNEVAEYTEAIENAADRWVVKQWCGRPDLAAKAIAKADASAVLVEVIDPRQS